MRGVVVPLLLLLLLQPRPTTAGCNLGTLASHLNQVSKHCCKGVEKNDCSKTGFPSKKGLCSLECAKILEPFWDSCGEVLGALKMIPPGMPQFYETCMGKLYAPGKCGPKCGLKQFHCRVMEVNTACCDDKDNCPSSWPTPKKCPVGCSLVYPSFLQQCEAIIKVSLQQQKETKALAAYKSFSKSCLRQHPAEVIEYAHTLLNQGCKLTLPKTMRRNGHDSRSPKPTALDVGGEPWFHDAGRDGCDSFHAMLGKIHKAESICCEGGNCGSGMPKTCSAECAVIFHGLFKTCGLLLQASLPAKDLARYASFDALCTDETSVDVQGFIKAIGSATCCSPANCAGCGDAKTCAAHSLKKDGSGCLFLGQGGCLGGDDLKTARASMSIAKWNGDHQITLYKMKKSKPPAAGYKSQATFKWYEKICTDAGLRTIKCGGNFQHNQRYFAKQYHSCAVPRHFGCNIGNSIRASTGWHDAVFFWDALTNGVGNNQFRANPGKEYPVVCAAAWSGC